MKNVIELQNRFPWDDPKSAPDNLSYIIYEEPPSGLGNRIHSFISSLVMSLATNRVLIVPKSSEVASLFEPIKRWSLDIETVFNEKDLQNSKRLSFVCCYQVNEIDWKGTVHVHNLNFSHGSDWDQMSCYDLNIAYPQKILYFFTNQFLASSFLNNENHEKRFLELLNYPVKNLDYLKYSENSQPTITSLSARFQTLIITSLAELTLQLTETYQEQVDIWKKRLSFENHFTVGLQIRTAYLQTHKHAQLFVECGTYLSDLSPFNDENKPFQIFVASDSTEVIEKLKQEFKTFFPIVFVNKTEVLDSYIHRFLDFWLLGESNEIILSMCSTFGIWSSIRRNIKPYWITHEEHCFQELSSHVCLHFSSMFPETSCYNNNRRLQTQHQICRQSFRGC